ncbi:MAG: FecR domain-containing protein [Acidobacteria bacterium]|nr:FecR domain-containing protein [Acidobacteriota bacterium]
MNDYLFNKVGEGEPEVVRLENLLGGYRQQRPFVFPPAAMKPWFARTWFRAAMAGAAAAIVLALIFASAAQGPSEWIARRDSGDPHLNSIPVTRPEVFRPGSIVTTDGSSELELKAAGHGRIRVLPGSEVRFTENSGRHQRLELRHGTIEASLYAPPFMFSFDTPSGTAYDIGCAFRLRIEEDGRGRVDVLSGWVQFEAGEAQELAPAGAQIEIEPGYGPGTAVFRTSGAGFRKAVHDVDFGGPGERLEALRRVLANARANDVYTLLRLMRGATAEERGMLFDRASQLKPPPAWVTRDGIMRREEAMMDAWTTSLGLGDAKRWWVHWKDRF